jgi:hypothetical protein
MLKQIIKNTLLIALISLSIGCSSTERVVVVKETAADGGTSSGYVVPAPTILESLRNSDFSFTINWIVSSAEGVDIDQFMIQYMKPEDTAWQILSANPTAEAITYDSAVNFFDQGFGNYKFRMRTADTNGDLSTFSNILTYIYSGYLNYSTKWSTFSPEGSNETSFNYPVAIAIDDTNIIYDEVKLYVADSYNDRILQFNAIGSASVSYPPDGIKKEIPSNELSVTGNEYKAGFSSPSGIAIGNDGSIYVADSENSRVSRFVPGSFESSFDSWGQLEIVAANSGISFSNPFYPKVCALEGVNLYVFDAGNSRILKIVFDANTGSTIQEVTEITSEQFGQVKGLTIGASLVYVSNSAGQINTISKADDSVSAFISAAGLDNPTGMALDESGEIKILYIANTNDHNIKVYNAVTGELILEDGDTVNWGKEGIKNGEFKYPSGLAYSNTKLFVSETDNNSTAPGGRIQVFIKPTE